MIPPTHRQIEESLARWETKVLALDSLETRIRNLETSVKNLGIEEASLLGDVEVNELKAAHRYAEIQALKIVRSRRLQIFKDRANQLMPDSEAAGLQVLLGDAIKGLLEEKEKAGELAAVPPIQRLWGELKESFPLEVPAPERIARARALADKIRTQSNPLLHARAA